MKGTWWVNLRFELFLEPHTGIQIQVVSGLVQQQHEGLDEQGSGQIEDLSSQSCLILCHICGIHDYFTLTPNMKVS